MNEAAKQILLCLLTAHFLGDFIFQTDADASRQKRLFILLKHAFIVAALGYLLCGIWDLWLLPLIIFFTHGLIDSVKVTAGKETAYWFILDQTAHLAVIAILFIALVHPKMIPVSKPSIFWVELLGKVFLPFLVVVSGLTASIKAGGILIELAVKPFTDELQKDQQGIKTQGASIGKGFENGGKVIGYLERSLIFLLILTGQPGGIGFLIAAKSILRFGEVKDRQNRLEAEYIIIGTLMSFGYGMFLAYVTQFFLSKV